MRSRDAGDDGVAVTEGECYASIIGGDVFHLKAGEVVVFTNGDPHVMASAPGMRGEAVPPDAFARMDLDKHQFAEPGQHARTARTSTGHFGGGELSELTQPAALTLATGHDHRRQIIENWIEGFGIASKKAADQARGGRPLGAVSEQEGKAAVPSCDRRLGALTWVNADMSR